MVSSLGRKSFWNITRRECGDRRHSFRATEFDQVYQYYPDRWTPALWLGKSHNVFKIISNGVCVYCKIFLCVYYSARLFLFNSTKFSFSPCHVDLDKSHSCQLGGPGAAYLVSRKILRFASTPFLPRPLPFSLSLSLSRLLLRFVLILRTCGTVRVCGCRARLQRVFVRLSPLPACTYGSLRLSPTPHLRLSLSLSLRRVTRGATLLVIASPGLASHYEPP